MGNLIGVKHTAQLQESLKLSNCERNSPATVYSMSLLWATLCSEVGNSCIHCKRSRAFPKSHAVRKTGLPLIRLLHSAASGRVVFTVDFQIQIILVKEMKIQTFCWWTLNFTYYHFYVQVILYYLIFSFTWRKLRAHWYEYRWEYLIELTKYFMNAETHVLLMPHLSWPYIFYSCGEQ